MALPTMNYDEEEPFRRSNFKNANTPEAYVPPYSRIIDASGYIATEYYNGQGVPSPKMERLRFRLVDIGSSAMDIDVKYN